MAEFVAFAAVAIAVPMLLALLVDWLWPSAPIGRLAVAASLILPVGLAVILVGTYHDSSGRPPNPDNIDGGMATALITVVGPILVVVLWAFGFPAAYEALERRRRKREP